MRCDIRAYEAHKCLVAFWIGISFALSAFLIPVTYSESIAESFLAATPSVKTGPSRNDRLETNDPTRATGGTSVGTSGTTIGTQRPTSSMKNTANLRNMDDNANTGARHFDAEKLTGGQPPPTPANVDRMSKSTDVREGLSESLAPFNNAGSKAPDLRPFGDEEPQTPPHDRSPADPNYRRYIDMPDPFPGNQPKLR